MHRRLAGQPRRHEVPDVNPRHPRRGPSHLPCDGSGACVKSLGQDPGPAGAFTRDEMTPWFSRRPIRRRPRLDRLRHAAVVESPDDAIVSKDLDGTIRSWGTLTLPVTLIGRSACSAWRAPRSRNIRDSSPVCGSQNNTRVGASRSVVVPSPSWPLALSPQQYVPCCVERHLCGPVGFSHWALRPVHS